MLPEEEKNRIEELKKSLYSRNAPDVRTRRKVHVEDIKPEVSSDWQHPSPPQQFVRPEPKKSMNFLTKLLIGSIIFCIIAVGIGAYLFLNGSNLISADNIEIAISGPVSIPGGTPISFDLVITNKNSVVLQNAELTIVFPKGATDVQNRNKELTNYREVLGDIAPGESVRKVIQAIIYGEQNTQKTLTADITYDVKGSSSSFTKEKTYDVLINSSPVNVTISSFNEITSGQEFDLTLDIKSNSSDTLKGVLASVTYPFGFTYLSSNLPPLPDKATWRLGDLPAGGSKTIKVHGKLQGEDQDTKAFRASVGSPSSRNQNAIGTEYMSAVKEIALKKSFMTVGLSLNGNEGSQDLAGGFNQPVTAEISWFNNLPSSISDVEITVKMSGSAYDKTLVQPREGYFRSATDEIVWNSQTTKKLLSVAAGDSGTVSFHVTPRNLGTGSKSITNPNINFTVSVKGRRSQESGVPESLSSIATRNIKISSQASLSGRIVRNGSNITNTGPIPPKAERRTTYTVVWSVDNTANALSNAQVTAVLPPYVKWTSTVNPTSENIDYDSKTGKVTWNVGKVSTYTATSGQRKSVAFQVAIEPSVAQVGSIPTLVNDATLTATDDYTGESLSSRQSYLTTRFSTDPSYRSGDEIVAK